MNGARKFVVIGSWRRYPFTYLPSKYRGIFLDDMSSAYDCDRIIFHIFGHVHNSASHSKRGLYKSGEKRLRNRLRNV